MLAFLSKIMLRGKEQYHSQYLKKLEEESIPIATSTNGFFNGFSGNLPQYLRKFFTFNWGCSPFLACNFYTVRYMANLVLKNHEYAVSVYCKKLQKQNQFVPAPTAISHYHFFDEAFHTTTSLFMARNLYQNFASPTVYEKFVANVAVYLAQRENLSHLSGVIPNRYVADSSLMIYIYRLLQSSIFKMSPQEAFHWMEKCFCQEHEGFHVNLKLHQSLLSDLRRFAEKLDYLWSVNREMRLMAQSASIDKAINNNIKSFKSFSETVSS